MLIGALEAGGTKMVCAIGDEEGKILDRISIPTDTPDISMPKVAEYFRSKDIKALGIGCFGPIDLNKDSKTYGYITSTPKKGWGNFDIVGYFAKELGVKVGFDTDVNASLLGEHTYGMAKDCDTAIYITVGTGIGLGVMANGKLLHGMLHPEAGHLQVLKHKDDTYEGHCPYHGTCIEGMACGPAIEARWGKKGAELSKDSKVWEIEAYYLAQAIYGYILTVSPKLIILGGGVMKQEILFDLIRKEVKKLDNSYLKTKEMENLDTYIVPASLNDNQGILGCIKLGLNALGV